MLDPGNIDALVGLAGADQVFGSGYMTDNRAPHLAAAEKPRPVAGQKNQSSRLASLR